MKRWINQLKTLKIKSVILAGIAAIALWIAPIASAQAATAAPDTASPGTVNRIQQKAEDFGGENIGDTGLKNINNLPNKIPETADLIIKQRSQDNNVTPNTQKDTKNAGEQIQKGLDSVKESVF
ncbi:MAG: hypothetical protein SAJ12_00105 [Jaaginema sp. PMC 1079.18]|nr:hypothetical protein [Jaaginema sp. PMC 1080.18]MEC4849386.1 hypothetical protein [Jaaginema sp. PMC 1079.18]MEC4865419.1 hypothetical protein [Jaaginema sp. PMC 1078.18]